LPLATAFIEAVIGSFAEASQAFAVEEPSSPAFVVEESVAAVVDVAREENAA